MYCLTRIFPLARGTAQGLQSALGGLGQKTAAPLPGIADFFKGVIPDNVFASATNGDILPLVVFAVLFALALGRISGDGRRSIVGFFEAIGDALLVIIEWVLWIAPLGVLALAFTVGSAAGGAAFAGLGHYVVLISVIGILVTLAGYPLAVIAGRVPLGEFTRADDRAPGGRDLDAVVARVAAGDARVVLAAMGISDQVADVTLPISVALFRATGPAMNTAVAFYVAHWLGLRAEPRPDDRRNRAWVP